MKKGMYRRVRNGQSHHRKLPRINHSSPTQCFLSLLSCTIGKVPFCDVCSLYLVVACAARISPPCTQGTCMYKYVLPVVQIVSFVVQGRISQTSCTVVIAFRALRKKFREPMKTSEDFDEIPDDACNFSSRKTQNRNLQAPTVYVVSFQKQNNTPLTHQLESIVYNPQQQQQQ